MIKKIFLIGLSGLIAFCTSPSLSAQNLDNNRDENTVSVSHKGQFPKISKIRDVKNPKTLINVPKISQIKKLPTGCESVSATMLLNFYGYKVSPNDFVDKCLITKKVEEHPDPNSAFVGSPYDPDSYGCFAPCIAKAMNKVLENGEHAKVIKGEPLKNIVDKYIDKHMPVLVWTTMSMRETVYRRPWKIGFTDENAEYKKGEEFRWPGNEHCMVLVGYNEKDYFVNDPLQEEDKVLGAYEKKLFEQRYKEQGSQVVVIEKDDAKKPGAEKQKNLNISKNN